MSANPVLTVVYGGELVPAPFPQEVFLLKRQGVQIDLDGVRTASGRCFHLLLLTACSCSNSKSSSAPICCLQVEYQGQLLPVQCAAGVCGGEARRIW